MTRKVALSQKQRAAVLALLASPTVEKAAAMAGCSTRSIHRWMKDAGFKQALREADRSGRGPGPVAPVVRPYSVPEVTARKVRRRRTEMNATETELCGLVYGLLLSDLERARVPLEIGSFACEMVLEDFEAERAERSLSWADDAGFPPRHEPFREA